MGKQSNRQGMGGAATRKHIFRFGTSRKHRPTIQGKGESKVDTQRPRDRAYFWENDGGDVGIGLIGHIQLGVRTYGYNKDIDTTQRGESASVSLAKTRLLTEEGIGGRSSISSQNQDQKRKETLHKGRK